MGTRGSSVDWESILKALIDGSLIELDIPSGITELRSNIFRDARNLQRVTIPEGVTKFNGSAFYGASNLESATLPSTLTWLSNYAFLNCGKLKNITIPSAVTNLGQQSFQNCNSLEYMILEGTTPPTIYTNTFTSNNCLFYVPDSAVNTYKAANVWNNLANRIKPISELGGVILDYQTFSGFSAERRAA